MPLRGERHFSERLTCSKCGGQGAFIWLIETPEPAPMFAGLSYLVNRWHDSNSSRLIETVARAGSEVIANIAFDASVTHYRGDYLTMQQRHRVIRDSRFKVVRGGRG
jgi:hypothetical protein